VRVNVLLSRLLPLAFLLGACSPGQTSEDAAASGAVEEEAEHELHLEPQQIQDWGIQFGPIGHTSISAELTLPGALTVNENRTAKAAPLVEGQISSIRVDLGSRVGAGEVLATLNSPEFTRAQTQFLQAFAQAELSRKDFERARVLRETRAIEEREFLRRQAVYEQHLADRRAAEVFLHSLGIGEDRMRELEAAVDVSLPPEDHRAVDPPLAVRAPVSGVVVERDAVLGGHVEPGQALFTVSDLSSLWARLDAYEDQMAYLETGSDVVIRTPLFPGRDFPGRVTVVADLVDEELRTVQVRAEIPNPDGVLKPNMYVQGLLRVQADGERMVVPVDAVQLLEGRNVVFVRFQEEPEDDHVVIRAVDVEPGETLSIGRIVESGLDGSEEIVTLGAFNLKAELTKGAGGHGHVH
jgi:cobalt-zinc-cadmium efflux system membrane fusion protein